MALRLTLNSSLRRSVVTSLRAMSSSGDGKGEWGSGAGKVSISSE